MWTLFGGLFLCESGGAGLVGVSLFEGDRGEHPEAAVPTDPIIERFDPVEDSGGQLNSGHPFLGVEQLGLHPAPERLDRRVIERVADTAERLGQPGTADPLTKSP